MVEFYGTVPTIPNALKGITEPDIVEFKGGFDKMNRMLTYLGDKTGNDYWTKSSIFFNEGAAVVQRISDVIIDYLSKKADNTDMLPKLFTEVLEKMISGYQALDF